jgi:uncharacterized membrane protein YfcA
MRSPSRWAKRALGKQELPADRMRGNQGAVETFLMLAGAGFLAGAMNALAGGGSFVTLPAWSRGVPVGQRQCVEHGRALSGRRRQRLGLSRQARGHRGRAARPLLVATLIGGFCRRAVADLDPDRAV